MHVERLGLVKIKLNDNGPGEIVMIKPILRKQIVSVVFLKGRLYVRSKILKTKDYEGNIVPYLLYDPETLQ